MRTWPELYQTAYEQCYCRLVSEPFTHQIGSGTGGARVEYFTEWNRSVTIPWKAILQGEGVDAISLERELKSQHLVAGPIVGGSSPETPATTLPVSKAYFHSLFPHARHRTRIATKPINDATGPFDVLRRWEKYVQVLSSEQSTAVELYGDERPFDYM